MGFGFWSLEENYLINSKFSSKVESNKKPKTKAQKPKTIFSMYYDKEGNEINPALLPMPRLCADCDKKDDIEEEILCTLTRLDQRERPDFVCHSYVSRYGVLNDDIIE